MRQRRSLAGRRADAQGVVYLGRPASAGLSRPACGPRETATDSLQAAVPRLNRAPPPRTPCRLLARSLDQAHLQAGLRARRMPAPKQTGPVSAVRPSRGCPILQQFHSLGVYLRLPAKGRCEHPGPVLASCDVQLIRVRFVTVCPEIPRSRVEYRFRPLVPNVGLTYVWLSNARKLFFVLAHLGCIACLQ